MTTHVREAEEGDVSGIMALWERFMQLLRDTNPDYWDVRDRSAAFSRYLVSAISAARALEVKWLSLLLIGQDPSTSACWCLSCSAESGS